MSHTLPLLYRVQAAFESAKAQAEREFREHENHQRRCFNEVADKLAAVVAEYFPTADFIYKGENFDPDTVHGAMHLGEETYLRVELEPTLDPSVGSPGILRFHVVRPKEETKTVVFSIWAGDRTPEEAEEGLIQAIVKERLQHEKQAITAFWKQSRTTDIGL
jgi:hypothetical protein